MSHKLCLQNNFYEIKHVLISKDQHVTDQKIASLAAFRWRLKLPLFHASFPDDW